MAQPKKKYVQDPSAEGYRQQSLIDQHKRDEVEKRDNAEGANQAWPTDSEYMKAYQDASNKQDLDQIRKQADGIKGAIPSYKKGGKVRKTGLALVHKGERVIPKNKVNSVVVKKNSSPRKKTQRKQG